MAYQPFYGVTDWQNLPSQKTALNRTNLLHAENGIKEADNRIVQLDNRKAELSLVNTLVKNVVLNPKTGVLTVTLVNGTTATYDLDIERVVTNFDITNGNVLVLTLADGTRKEVDLTKFVNTFSNTATVSMRVENRVVTANIIDGSVTMGKLDAAIQTEFRQYMLDAKSARDMALQYQKSAKRYALGDGEFPGSDTDNAKYYYEQTKSNAGTVAANAQTSTTAAETATAQATISTQKAAAASASATSAAGDAILSGTKSQEAMAAATRAGESAKLSTDKANLSTTKATESLSSAQTSKRYAVGGVVAEDAQDNANWYYQQTKELKEQVGASVVVPKGEWSAQTQYKIGDLVSKDGSSYISRVTPPIGTLPTDTNYWQLFAAIYKHPSSGAVAGTYRSVAINAQGHVTAGTNPTTLAGYGITDAAASGHNHDNSYVKITPIRNIALTATKWSTSYPHTQAVQVAGIKASDNIKVIGLATPSNATGAQVKAVNKAAGYLMHSAGGIVDGRLTFRAYKKPAVDITIITEGG